MIRKYIFLNFMLFAFTTMQAQDYQINFTGSGVSTTVETVQVQNLTQGTSLNLSGSDVLNLTATVTGIEQLTTNGDNTPLPRESFRMVVKSTI